MKGVYFLFVLLILAETKGKTSELELNYPIIHITDYVYPLKKIINLLFIPCNNIG